jgi:hypothetical protein
VTTSADAAEPRAPLNAWCALDAESVPAETKARPAAPATILLARENPFLSRDVDAEEEESNDPLAFAKSGFSSAVFVTVVFIIVCDDKKKKQKLQLFSAQV